MRQVVGARYRKRVDREGRNNYNRACKYLTGGLMIMNSEKLSIVVIFIAFLVVIGFSGIYAQGDRSVEVIDAIKRGSVADLKKLAAEGVEMNVADEQGVTYLILAVRMGNKEIVKVLVDAGADVNAK